jgi:lysophospholipid hydrolase
MHRLIRYVKVILTRFSRVTFQSAHKYLGLTSELLRTEKAINDIACHPLPRAFYEGGGIETLRQRFQHSVTGPHEAEYSEEESDYFTQLSDDTRSKPSRQSVKPRGRDRRATVGRTRTGNTSVSSSTSTAIASNIGQFASGGDTASAVAIARPTSPAVAIPQISEAKKPITNSPITPFKPTASRTSVTAGDLHTSTGQLTDAIQGSARRQQTSGSNLARRLSGSSSLMREAGRMQFEDFDLREEVMSCIAKSIGLLQPPLSNYDSTQASPMPFEDHSDFSGSAPQTSAMFNPSFSSLLQGDDAASSLSSSAVSQNATHMSGLDNEVEILTFPAGSLIVKAGEKNAGEH